jgi:hypothetical protein
MERRQGSQVQWDKPLKNCSPGKYISALMILAYLSILLVSIPIRIFVFCDASFFAHVLAILVHFLAIVP